MKYCYKFKISNNLKYILDVCKHVHELKMHKIKCKTLPKNINEIFGRPHWSYMDEHVLNHRLAILKRLENAIRLSNENFVN